MRQTLILQMTKRVMALVTAVMMMLEKAQNREITTKRNLTPSRLKNLLLDDSDDELTDHHDGANGALAQLINMKQEARKSVWMEKEKAYLSVRLRCAALLEISISAPLDCEVIFMMLLTMLRLIRSLEISISGALSTTQQREEAVQH